MGQKWLLGGGRDSRIFLFFYFFPSCVGSDFVKEHEKRMEARQLCPILLASSFSMVISVLASRLSCPWYRYQESRTVDELFKRSLWHQGMGGWGDQKCSQAFRHPEKRKQSLRWGRRRMHVRCCSGRGRRLEFLAEHGLPSCGYSSRMVWVFRYKFSHGSRFPFVSFFIGSVYMGWL